MKRPNESQVTLGVVVSQITNGQKEGTITLTGARADSISILASLMAHPTRYSVGAFDSIFNILGHVDAHRDDLADELKKAPVFVDPNELAETCFALSAFLLRYVEEVCWKPENWRKP
jgi:hypothetical protein